MLVLLENPSSSQKWLSLGCVDNRHYCLLRCLETSTGSRVQNQRTLEVDPVRPGDLTTDEETEAGGAASVLTPSPCHSETKTGTTSSPARAVLVTHPSILLWKL